MGNCSRTGFLKVNPDGPTSTGSRSCGLTPATCAAGGIGACCIDEIETATGWPGGNAPGSTCTAVPCTLDSGASTATVPPFGSLGSTCAEASTTELAAVTWNDCVTVCPFIVAETVKAWSPPCVPSALHA